MFCTLDSFNVILLGHFLFGLHVVACHTTCLYDVILFGFVLLLNIESVYCNYVNNIHVLTSCITAMFCKTKETVTQSYKICAFQHYLN